MLRSERLSSIRVTKASQIMGCCLMGYKLAGNKGVGRKATFPIQKSCASYGSFAVRKETIASSWLDILAENLRHVQIKSMPRMGFVEPERLPMWVGECVRQEGYSSKVQDGSFRAHIRKVGRMGCHMRLV